MNLPYSESVGHYWRTGEKRDPDKWLDMTEKQIEEVGGKVLRRAFGSDTVSGNEAYILEFELNKDVYRIVWPVLPTKYRYPTSQEKDIRRARRVQATTAMYHHVKAACMDVAFRGGRAAFFSHLLLPDGRTAVQATSSELMTSLPDILNVRMLKAGE